MSEKEYWFRLIPSDYEEGMNVVHIGFVAEDRVSLGIEIESFFNTLFSFEGMKREFEMEEIPDLH